MEDSITRQVMQHAASFLSRHSQEPGVGPIFRSFTRKPMALLNQKRLCHLIQELRAVAATRKGPLRVLDLGCGGGVLTCAFAALGHSTLGMDRSGPAIRLAKLFAVENDYGGRFFEADLARDLQWMKAAEEILGGKPDVIVLAYTLDQLAEPEMLLASLGTWLAPQAPLLINTRNPAAPLFRIRQWIRNSISGGTSRRHRTYTEWKDVLKRCGFEAGKPHGLDLMPGVGRFVPGKAGSLVFTAIRG